MKAESRTLQRIFEQSICYCVPLFQRPYVWNESENWEPLWEDVRRLAEPHLTENAGQRTHFIGAIVLEQLAGATGSIETRQIIDGQQRLTTLQILLTVLKDLSQESGSMSYKTRFEKFSRNDEAFIDAPDQAFKVWPTNPDRCSFQITLRAGGVEKLKQQTGEARSDGQFINSQIPKAYQYFANTIRSWLDALPGGTDWEHGLAALWLVIRSQLRLVTIDLEAEDDAQVIFETLNYRGADLLPADLIKNYLFRQAQMGGVPVEELYDLYWKAFDDRWWRDEMRQGRLKRPRLDIFLQHYLSLKTRDDVLVTHVFDTYKEFAKHSGLSAERLVQQLAKYGKVFKRLVLPHDSPRVNLFLNRLSAIDTATVYPFLLESFRLYDQPEGWSELEAIVCALESFLVRRMVCHLTSKNYNRLFLELLGHCEENGGVSSKALIEFLKKSNAETARWPNDNDFKRALQESQLYNLLTKPKVRLVLRALDQALETGLSEHIQIQDDLTIEHLLPQRWEDHWPIATEDEAERLRIAQTRDLLKHTLGNLTLLTSKLNPSISNSAWATKRVEILKQSKLNLNRAFQDLSVWDTSEIHDRSEKLADLAAEIWPIALDPNDQPPTGPPQNKWKASATKQTSPSPASASFLIKGQCTVCGKPLDGMMSIVQYSNYYHCESDWGIYICPNCYNSGTSLCPKCDGSLSFHSGAAAVKRQRDRPTLY